jgi:hypothetical protein
VLILVAKVFGYCESVVVDRLHRAEVEVDVFIEVYHGSAA